MIGRIGLAFARRGILVRLPNELGLRNDSTEVSRKRHAVPRNSLRTRAGATERPGRVPSNGVTRANLQRSLEEDKARRHAGVGVREERLRTAGRLVDLKRAEGGTSIPDGVGHEGRFAVGDGDEKRSRAPSIDVVREERAIRVDCTSNRGGELAVIALGSKQRHRGEDERKNRHGVSEPS